MAAPTIPLYTGVTPNRNQSANDFANNADDWLNYQAPLATDYNNLAAYLDALALTPSIDDITVPYIFKTVQEFKDFPFEFVEDKIIRLRDRRADFTKSTGTGSGNDANIIDSTSADQSIDLIKELPLNPVAYGVNPSSLDNSPVWQLLLNDNDVTHVHFSEVGAHTFLSKSGCTRGISVTFANGVKIDCKDPAFVGNCWTEFSGSLPQIENLGVNAVKGARVVTFASAPTLQVGDVFSIWNPTDFSFSAFRAQYYAGEMCKVVGISGNTVTVANDLYASYSFGDVNVYRLDGINVNIGNIDIEGDVSASLVDIIHGKDCYIESPKALHKNNSVFSIKRCYNTTINEPALHNEGDGGDDYAISWVNCQVGRVTGGDIYARRHSITTGGGSDVGSVPCRNLKFSNLTLANDINSNVHNADFHGNTEDSQYLDCTIFGGATWQGRDNGYINCDISPVSNGACILSAELIGGTHYARDCRLKTEINPQPNGRGIVDVGGNTDAITDKAQEGLTFDVSGSKLTSDSLSATTSLMIVKNRGSIFDINVNARGVITDVNDMLAILNISLVTGTASSKFIIVDEVTDLRGLFAKELVRHSTADYLDEPHALQKLSGREVVTVSGGVNTATGTPVGYKWTYPRQPVIMSSRTARAYIGTELGGSYANPVGLSGHTNVFSTTDAANFSGGSNVTLNWTVSIEEV